MQLTVNEMVYLLKLWNSWYLISHDENLNSEDSVNETVISISPFDCTRLSEEVRADLKDYTDYFDPSDKKEFNIRFVFNAGDHQPDMIFDALRSVLEKADGAKLEIRNTMHFISADLPDPASDEPEMDENIKALIASHKKETGEGTATPEEVGEKEKAEENAPNSPVPGEKELPENVLTLKGLIQRDGIIVEELEHNGKEFPLKEKFLEASRLFETVDRNFTLPETGDKMGSFECQSESEAGLVKVYLVTSMEYKPHSVEGKVIKTTALPEELAGIISYIRYRADFELFRNPLIKNLRYRRKLSRRAYQRVYHKACSCLVYAVAIAIMLVIWWIVLHKK